MDMSKMKSHASAISDRFGDVRALKDELSGYENDFDYDENDNYEFKSPTVDESYDSEPAPAFLESIRTSERQNIEFFTHTQHVHDGALRGHSPSAPNTPPLPRMILVTSMNQDIPMVGKISVRQDSTTLIDTL